MLIRGNNYNFGRVVYLTIGKTASAPYSYKGLLNEKLTDRVTIAFDPKTNPQLNTRIDFLIRHQYKTVNPTVTGSAVSYANIDLYNIGPALQQFLNAYNVFDNEGYWQSIRVNSYVCALQVGYYGGKLTTIFAGVVNSYNVERKQSATSVDTVWHLYAAGTGGNNSVSTPLSDSELAVSGKDYTGELEEENKILQSFTKGEDYIRAAVMKHPRTVFPLVTANNFVVGNSFSTHKDMDNVKENEVPMGQTIIVDESNFDKYFEIKYQSFNTGKVDEEAKLLWTTESSIALTNINYFNLSQALANIAATKNCYAEVRMDNNTGKQIIYIYTPGATTQKYQKHTDYVIINFQNLQKPPMVSGKTLQLKMMMEPSIRSHDTLELQVTKDFMQKYKNPSFGVSYSGVEGNFGTRFAGANFSGFINTENGNQTLENIKKTGNVFNKRYQILFVVHQGSTHEAEWSTTVDCAGIKTEED